jgi:sugar O-acyltransferase (sialic acid O-acetyltransferase NeuD family)
MAPAPAPLVLVGSGGFGRETAEAVRAINAAHKAATGAPLWTLRGFADDARERWGTVVSGTPVLGPIDGVATGGEHGDAAVVVCTGHPGDFASRRRIVERLGLPAARYATLVHPAAVVPASCALGAGTVVLAGTVLTVDVTVGDHVAVMPQCVLTHDDVVGDYATLGAGVRLAGGARVEDGAYLGSGCLIREGRTIGAGALVGMGAVVTRDVGPAEVWAGVPARRLRAVGDATS